MNDNDSHLLLYYVEDLFVFRCWLFLCTILHLPACYMTSALTTSYSNDGQFFIFIVEDGHHSYHHRATTNKQQQQPAAPQPPAATSNKEPHRAESSLFKFFCISHKLHLYSNFEKERKNDLKCFRRSLKINDICELFDKILMTELKNQFFDKI